MYDDKRLATHGKVSLGRYEQEMLRPAYASLQSDKTRIHSMTPGETEEMCRLTRNTN